MKKINKIGTPLGSILIGDNCGEGGTFIVKKALLDSFSQEFAIKFLAEDVKNKISNQYNRFKQAYLNLFCNTYKLPVLPQFYFGHVEIEDKFIPYTLMPFCPKTLKQHKKNIGNEFCAKHFEPIFKSLLNNTEMLHQHGIVHRDLKPENIFIDGNRLSAQQRFSWDFKN